MMADKVDDDKPLLPRPRHRNRKLVLVLVLDLDHTLIHTTSRRELSLGESYLLRHPDLKHRNPNTHSLFAISPDSINKLRPFARTLLHLASRLFDMYIYTLATRQYADAAADILDLGRRCYFCSPSKVISREDGHDRRNKRLDLVPADERTVIIVDDNTNVWKKHLDNLSHIEAYNFFAAAGKSLSELRKDEMVHNGRGLAGVLDVLHRAHQAYFDPDIDTAIERRDVRVVLREMQLRVLEGCRIVFNRRVEDFYGVCLIAVKMGAKYAIADGSATHVVESTTETKKARWAVENGKFLVTAGWVKAAYYAWRRPKEEDYPVVIGTSTPTQTDDNNNYFCCCCTIM